MNCINCDAHKEDLQTGDHYCRELKALVSPGDVKCLRQQVKTCLKANVSIFQDGYIDCSLIESSGCEACYREFEERTERS